MTEPGGVLRIQDVGVVRDGATLLDSVDWYVEEDERWAIIGPNGAGKTTLLQIAAAMAHPTRGSARILGERLGAVDLSELRPRIGFTSVSLAERIPPGEKVIDLVLTGSYAVVGRWQEEYTSEDVHRAVALLQQLGCEQLIKRRFGSLSEGERKRVQIARALMPDPELLLLDEPAAGLDLGAREDLLRRLAELAYDDRAPCLVLVTHHVEEIPAGFTHGMLLREGGIVASGPLGSVVTEDNLSRCFGLPLTLDNRGGRWNARALFA